MEKPNDLNLLRRDERWDNEILEGKEFLVLKDPSIRLSWADEVLLLENLTESRRHLDLHEGLDGLFHVHGQVGFLLILKPFMHYKLFLL